MAVCGIQCVDLVLDTIKLLGTHFSYNEKLKEERNFCLIIANIQRVLKLWKLRNLILEGKILILQTLALSKILFEAFLTPIPIYVVTELEKIQKSFLWENSTSKIKHDTLCNDYKYGGLKNVDLRKKIISLHCSWIKRLYDDSFHEWKIIPLHLISRSFDKSFCESYCDTNDETPIHLFRECNSTKSLWPQLNRRFHSDLNFPELTLQTAIVGIFNDSAINIHLLNHILLLFKLYIYKSRNKHRLNIHELLANILNIKKLEKVTAIGNVKKVAAYNKKWDITNRKLPL